MNKIRKEIRQSALAPAIVTTETGEQSFCFAEEFSGFDGHFPDYPILPAILQTLLAQTLAEQVVGEPLQFCSLLRAKFTRQLRPGDRIEVGVICQNVEGLLKCLTQLQVDNEAASSFTIMFNRRAKR